VVRRALSLRRRRYASSATVGVLVVAGLTLPILLLWSLGSKTGDRAPSHVASAPLPEVADIVCDQDGAHVVTPQVQPQRDGVHFHLDNRTGEARSFDVKGPGMYGALGTSAPPGKS